MKTITFFSEKGGVGKSSTSIMFASFLKYKYGVKVGLADFNNRITGYRNSEINNRNRIIRMRPELNLQPYDEKSAWPIVAIKFQEVNEYKRNGSQMPFVNWFEDEITKGRLAGNDVVICDFPGSLSGGEFLQLNSVRDLSLTVIPTERDEMTLQSTIKLHNAIKDYNHCVFINKAQLGLKNFRSAYHKLAQKLVENGMPVLPDMVSYTERMMTIDKVDIIRSTFGFPDFDAPEFGKAKDLGIENLFIDVLRELKKAPDLKGTTPADLSFVDNLQKKDDGRQFKGSAFPQYEI